MFPKAAKRAKAKRERERLRLLALQQQNAPAIKKVSGPSYYNYAPERYRKLNTKPLIQKLEKQQASTQNIHTIEIATLGQNAQAHPVLMANLASATMNDAMPSDVAPKLNADSLSTIHVSAEKQIAKAIEAHYAKSPHHLWLDKDYNLTVQADSVLYAFRRAHAYGLDPEHYQLKGIEQLISEGASLEDAATEFELSLTVNVLRYMADAKDGVINPNKISGYHDFGDYSRRYETHLKKIVSAENPARIMFDSHPDNAQFKSLKKELFELSKQDDGIKLEPIKKGTFIRPGNDNPELPKNYKSNFCQRF